MIYHDITRKDLSIDQLYMELVEKFEKANV